ncbi:hypothetical protein ACFE04_022492 [Oxalis oulophora]
MSLQRLADHDVFTKSVEELSHENLIKMSTHYNDNMTSLLVLLDQKYRTQSALLQESRDLQQKTFEELQTVLAKYEKQSQELESYRVQAVKYVKEKDARQKLEMEVKELREKFKVMEHLRNEAVQQLENKKSELREKTVDLNACQGINNYLIVKERNNVKEKKLEMEVKELREDFKVIKHLQNEAAQQMENKKLELQEKTDDLNACQEIYNYLIVKERKINDEIQEARKVLMEGLKRMTEGSYNIGIKLMGSINRKPFSDACMLKFSPVEYDWEVESLCSMWDDNIRDPHWHPFKVQIVNGKAEEVINEDDPKLKQLREEWGDAVYNAVAIAMTEMNEYNASGRFAIPEIWNFQENRKATLSEVVDFIIQNPNPKRRRRVIGCACGRQVAAPAW